MTRWFPDKPTPFQRDASDDFSSQARTERLLRDSQEASRFAHELKQIDALHGMAWGGSHFNPNQPRVPAGNPDGGQWTAVGGVPHQNDPRTASDAMPDSGWKPGARYASGQRRGYVSIRIGERWVEVEAGQAARFVEAHARAQDAIARVRELDPSSRPAPSISESVEGLIRR